jgi:uncharacterized membrane protein (UPF0182 family)
VVALAAREVITDRLEGAANNYVNTKMKHTHANGVVMSPLNSVTEQGQPYFVIRDFPPRSQEGAPVITESRIYFGEHIKDYVIVGTKDKEQDDVLSSGYSYKGDAGIPLTFLNRLLFTVKYSDIKLLASDQITSESKLLTNRSVLSRVQKAAPFLTFDSDAYILIDDAGKLKWVIDGYTTSPWFPYSQYNGDINYIRNSVKAVIDAYNGSVDFYIVDKQDPIIRSYNRIYPTLFNPAPFPEDLAKHLRYPGTIFRMQSDLLKRYHVDNVAVFYEKRDAWATPQEKQSPDKDINVEPYYGMIKMPDSKKEEFVLMQPYTSANKSNMKSLLAASCEGEGFGKLIIYNFLNNDNISGPYQIDNKISSDEAITKEIAQIKQADLSVTQGKIIIVPINNSILYIKPIYVTQTKNSDKTPELKKVIVAYNDKLASEPTLDEALNTLFGVNRPAVVISNEESIEDIVNNVVDSFEEMTGFSKQGDWENYGKALKKLEGFIQVLKEKNEKNAEINELPPLTKEQ